MSLVTPDDRPMFTSETRETFLAHVHENPKNRRLTQDEKRAVIEWLTDPNKRPSSQKEFSRRNYIWKNFLWDEQNQSLFAFAKEKHDVRRTVITEDMIADAVEYVHGSNNHAGWDLTWKHISSSYYGILRSDVIFLLKKCQICALDPCKRPKAPKLAASSSAPVDHDFLNMLGGDSPPYYTAI